MVRYGRFHDDWHIFIEEKLAIFLYWGHTGLPFVHIAECFQQSQSTISLVLHNVCDCVRSIPFQSCYLHLPTSQTPIPQHIWQNSRFFPFFSGALGAVDCTHSDTITSAEAQAAHRNQKGRVSQNIFAACTFDMFFCFLLCGWEGSASDGQIFEDARRFHEFRVPEGFYYLADAGFPSCKVLLTPYRGVRYHLREWAQSGWQQPATYQELFNLRHSQLQNVIERIFGVAKKKFLVFKNGANFAPDEQASFLLALFVIFNFICITVFSFAESESAAAAAAQRAFEFEIGHDGRVRRRSSSSRPSPVESVRTEETKLATHRHICPRCHKRFNWPSSVLAHGRTHTGLKLQTIHAPLPAIRPWFQRAVEYAATLQHSLESL